MKSHINRVHIDEIPLQCNNCGKTLANKRALKHHNEIFHFEDDNKFLTGILPESVNELQNQTKEDKVSTEPRKGKWIVKLKRLEFHYD